MAEVLTIEEMSKHAIPICRVLLGSQFIVNNDLLRRRI
jgi:hypothetical protein